MDRGVPSEVRIAVFSLPAGLDAASAGESVRLPPVPKGDLTTGNRLSTTPHPSPNFRGTLSVSETEEKSATCLPSGPPTTTTKRCLALENEFEKTFSSSDSASLADALVSNSSPDPGSALWLCFAICVFRWSVNFESIRGTCDPCETGGDAAAAAAPPWPRLCPARRLSAEVDASASHALAHRRSRFSFATETPRTRCVFVLRIPVSVVVFETTVFPTVSPTARKTEETGGSHFANLILTSSLSQTSACGVTSPSSTASTTACGSAVTSVDTSAEQAGATAASSIATSSDAAAASALVSHAPFPSDATRASSHAHSKSHAASRASLSVFAAAAAAASARNAFAQAVGEVHPASAIAVVARLKKTRLFFRCFVRSTPVFLCGEGECGAFVSFVSLRGSSGASPYSPFANAANVSTTGTSASTPRPVTMRTAASPACESGGDPIDGHVNSAHVKIANSSRDPDTPSSSGSAERTPQATSRMSARASFASNEYTEGFWVDSFGTTGTSSCVKSFPPRGRNSTRENTAAAASGSDAPFARVSAATTAGATPVFKRVLELKPDAIASLVPAVTHNGLGNAIAARETATHSLVTTAAFTDAAAK
mmetsp:Transcript_11539/g.42749  ORF Transcript_11539/g.42749 Transcript_11539/m.42749 type:complete len:598 (-) Transcript_11539:1330-3123(-)